MSLTLTRRAWLRLAALLSLGAGARPRPARSHGRLADLASEESIKSTLKRLFGARPIKGDAAFITIDMPLIAGGGVSVPIAIEVAAGGRWSATAASSTASW